MDRNLLTAELDNLGALPINRMQTIAASHNAAIERRIAAVLWCVAGSKLPLGDAAMDIILCLTGSEQECANPLDTPWGRRIVAVMGDTVRRSRQPSDDLPVGEHLALTLIGLAKDPDAMPNDSLDTLLRHTTGQGAMWWIEWIRGSK